MVHRRAVISVSSPTYSSSISALSADWKPVSSAISVSGLKPGANAALTQLSPVHTAEYH